VSNTWKTPKLKLTASFYGVDAAVLNTLGKISTARGDATSARKFDPNGTRLTGAEIRWLETAVRALIRRVGECDSDPPRTAD